MTEADADICSHVIAERRTSSTNAPIESFGVLPPLVRRSSASSEAPRTCRRHSTGCRQRPYGFIPGQPNRGPPLANSSKHASGSSPHLQPIPQATPPPIQDEAMTKEDEDDVHCTSRQYRIRENTPIPISTPTSNRASGASDQTAYLSEGGQDTHDFSEKSDRWSKDLEANGGERYRTWSLWASESVATNALVPALVTQALATGLLDATTYADFNTFASNQTGNAILLTLAAVGTVKTLIILTGASFGGFITGAFVFGQIGHYIGVRKRAWLLVSTAIQTLFLVVAAILLSPVGPKATAIGAKHEWTVLWLFATMSGGQVAMARQSSCQELPTAPMTSTFVDFVADHYLFAGWSDPRATSRNRRLYYVVVMLGGSTIGAVMHRWCNSWSVVVLAVGVKLGALVLLALAQPDPSK